jgi:hypothetical protein
LWLWVLMRSLPAKIAQKSAYEMACLAARCLAGSRVANGPFAGMLYRRSKLAAYPPKILGTYELEIAEAVDRLCHRTFQRIVNVGAAEGYYAVGFALPQPDTSIVAYEAREALRRDLVRLAADNKVADKLEIRGLCRPSDLNEVLAGVDDVLLVVDVEGAERELLDPAAVPKLSQVSILVELHDFVVPDVSSLIRRRFAATHTITEVRSRPRELGDLSAEHLSWVYSVCPRRLIELGLNEGRPCEMDWFVLEPAVQGLGRRAEAARGQLS